MITNGRIENSGGGGIVFDADHGALAGPANIQVSNILFENVTQADIWLRDRSRNIQLSNITGIGGSVPGYGLDIDNATHVQGSNLDFVGHTDDNVRIAGSAEGTIDDITLTNLVAQNSTRGWGVFIGPAYNLGTTAATSNITIVNPLICGNYLGAINQMVGTLTLLGGSVVGTVTQTGGTLVEYNVKGFPSVPQDEGVRTLDIKSVVAILLSLIMIFPPTFALTNDSSVRRTARSGRKLTDRADT
jgi:hypothetical protein